MEYMRQAQTKAAPKLPSMYFVRAQFLVFRTIGDELQNKGEVERRLREMFEHGAIFHDHDDLEVRVKADTDPDWDESFD